MLYAGFFFLVAFIILTLFQSGTKEVKKFAKGQTKSEAQKIEDMDEKSVPIAQNEKDDLVIGDGKTKSEWIELIAQNEINQKNQDKSLWYEANNLADGDQEKRKIEYIKLRVKDLSS